MKILLVDVELEKGRNYVPSHQILCTLHNLGSLEEAFTGPNHKSSIRAAEKEPEELDE